MLEVILLIVVGMYIGWNVAMPEVARNFQNKIIELFNKKS